MRGDPFAYKLTDKSRASERSHSRQTSKPESVRRSAFGGIACARAARIEVEFGAIVCLIKDSSLGLPAKKIVRGRDLWVFSWPAHASTSVDVNLSAYWPNARETDLFTDMDLRILARGAASSFVRLGGL